jgi:hypothetical protein
LQQNTAGDFAWGVAAAGGATGGVGDGRAKSDAGGAAGGVGDGRAKSDAGGAAGGVGGDGRAKSDAGGGFGLAVVTAFHLILALSLAFQSSFGLSFAYAFLLLLLLLLLVLVVVVVVVVVLGLVLKRRGLLSADGREPRLFHRGGDKDFHDWHKTKTLFGVPRSWSTFKRLRNWNENVQNDFVSVVKKGGRISPFCVFSTLKTILLSPFLYDRSGVRAYVHNGTILFFFFFLFFFWF